MKGHVVEWLNDRKADDEMYMLAALNLARRGEGWVNPNPQVGCVIVKHGEIVGQGWHTRFGELHAEREALADCLARGEVPAGATVYVTLEPCCHYGKTPPCTEALIEANVKRVVVGAPDPNPLVAGKGCAALREAGIRVDEGVLLDECTELNRAWLHYIRTKRPYVFVKYAMTADGRIATRPGASQWLTGSKSVQRAHHDRHAYAAIMVGVGTILTDNSELTCRWTVDENELAVITAAGAVKPRGVRQPLRVVVDGLARTPVDSKVVQTASEDAPVLIAVTSSAPQERVAALQAAGATVEVIPSERARDDVAGGYEAGNRVDLDALIAYLGERGIDSLIVEGGPTLHASVIRQGLANAVQVYVAGRVFGGAGAPGPVGGAMIDSPSEGVSLVHPRVELLGPDVLVQWELVPNEASPRRVESPEAVDANLEASENEPRGPRRDDFSSFTR